MPDKNNLLPLLAVILDSLEGEAGKVGERGEKGEAGEAGSAGKDGANGADGKDGVAGKAGKDGKAGSSGADGVDGTAGEQGPKGDKGEDAPAVTQEAIVETTTPVIVQMVTMEVARKVASKTYSVTELEGMVDATPGQVPTRQADGSWAPVTPAVGGGGAVDSVNTRTGAVTGLAENSDLVSHTSSTVNPHSVTKAQVGLSNVPNTDFTAAVDANTAKISFDATSSTRLANTSGTNTGDNATNSQYSGLAASKQDTLVSATNIKTINGNSVLGSGDLIVGGSLTKGIAEVNFGTTEQGEAVVTVVAAAITATTYPVVTMYALSTADHDPDDYMAEGVTAYVTNVVAGVGFDIAAGCNDTTWGKYAVTFSY